MSDATITRLGEVRPATEPDLLDARPVVLWSRGGLAAVFSYQLDADGNARKAKQNFEPVYGDAKAIHYHGSLPKDVEREAPMNLVEPDKLLTADVNGDGVDELILPRSLGAIDVHAAKGELFDFPPPCPDYMLGYYEPRSSFVAQLANRAVVYVLMARRLAPDEGEETGEALARKLAQHGLKDDYALVRVDERGIARVFLLGLPSPETEVLAVGAINRPNSEQIDELLAIVQDPKDRQVYLSRHLPTGQLIDKPRKIYVEFSSASLGGFEFLPHSDRAVFRDRDLGLYFITPAKPANWIRRVELSALGDPNDIRFLPTIDLETDPKALVVCKDKQYAVNQEGEFFTLETGAWKATKEPKPFYEVRPESPLHQVVEIVPSRTSRDRFLVVQTRARQARKLAREEIQKAAGEYLSPETLAEERNILRPRLPGEDGIQNEGLRSRMEEERVKRGVAAFPKALEDWKSQLPDTYAAELKGCEDYYFTSIEVDLLKPLQGRQPMSQDELHEDYRNVDQYLQWLSRQTVDSETVLSLVARQSTVAAARLAGVHPGESGSHLTGPWVAFLDSGNTFQAVLMLERGNPRSGDTGFYLVTAH